MRIEAWKTQDFNVEVLTILGLKTAMIMAYLKTMISPRLERVVSCHLACMTGALWAKRGERDISRGARHEREARDEGKRKIWVEL